VLEVNNLTRRYGDFLAVSGASFSVGNGEIIGLLGHNGAGKTTIMKMLSGFLEPDSGTVSVAGEILSENIESVKSNIGYLPENLPIYPEMSVIDYLDYAAVLKGLHGKDKQQEIRNAIRATDLNAKVLDPISTLSRGYKQRVGVAQALLGRPKLLILDEPTNGLDPQQTEHMRELIRRIAKTATVLLSTHIMQEVEALCSRVLIMHSGSLIVDATLEELTLARELRMVTNVDFEQGKIIISSVPGIKDIKHETGKDGSKVFFISIENNVEIDRTSSELAKGIVGAGFDLYSLHVVKQDLETLFREVVTGKRIANDFSKEVSNAA